MIAATDKIIRFKNLDDLKTAIDKDLKSTEVLAQRYCVRFIMLNDFKTFRELTKFLAAGLGVKMFELQNLTLGDDKTVTIDMLSDAIEGISETSLVTPFSELVRFYKEEDFNGFFNEIILTEDLKHPGKRIYIPIIGLNNRFNDFLKNFGRIQESAPIWQLYSQQDDKVKVFVSKFKTPFLPEGSEYYKLDTMKDWLNFWRKQAPQKKFSVQPNPLEPDGEILVQTRFLPLRKSQMCMNLSPNFLAYPYLLFIRIQKHYTGRNCSKQFLLFLKELSLGSHTLRNTSTHGNLDLNES